MNSTISTFVCNIKAFSITLTVYGQPSGFPMKTTNIHEYTIEFSFVWLSVENWENSWAEHFAKHIQQYKFTNINLSQALYNPCYCYTHPKAKGIIDLLHMNKRFQELTFCQKAHIILEDKFGKWKLAVLKIMIISGSKTFCHESLKHEMARRVFQMKIAVLLKESCCENSYFTFNPQNFCNSMRNAILNKIRIIYSTRVY